MVLSSVLNQGSRLLRSPAVLGAAAGRGAFRNAQQTSRAAPSPSAAAGAWSTVRVGVHHRAFWDWSGAGKGGDQGAPKGSGGAAGNGGRSGGGGNAGHEGKGKFGGSSECPGTQGKRVDNRS